MFFKLIHPQFYDKPLIGTISSDGASFFRTKDVARLMNLKDRSHFSVKYGKWQIKDIVYKKLKLEHPSVLKIRVLCRVTSAYFLDNARKANASPIANVLLDWDKHQVSFPENWTPLTKMNDAMPCFILPENEHSGISLKSFIQQFALKTLDLYNKLSKEHDMNCMDIYYPSLKSLQMDEAPKTIHLFFEDKQYTYTFPNRHISWTKAKKRAKSRNLPRFGPFFAKNYSTNIGLIYKMKLD